MKTNITEIILSGKQYCMLLYPHARILRDITWGKKLDLMKTANTDAQVTIDYFTDAMLTLVLCTYKVLMIYLLQVLPA